MLDFNHQNPTEMINALIDQALSEQRSKEPPRSYLGASRLGNECLRALQFEYTNTPQDQELTGDKLRIFALGHLIEGLITEWLRMAGFHLVTTIPAGPDYGEQIGFSQLNGKIRGHRDGVFIDGPDFLKYPCLWECKGLGHKYFMQLKREGLKKYSPVYYGQVQTYQAYFNLQNPAIFTAIDKDNCQMLHLPIEFDPAVAQACSDNGLQVIRACEARELLPRISQDPSFYKCKLCSYHNFCHTLDY